VLGLCFNPCDEATAMSVGLVVPAAGSGSRAGEDKLWSLVGDRPLIALTLEAVVASRCFDRIVVVAPERRHAEIGAIALALGPTSLTCVAGGPRRRDSVLAGLTALPDCDIVAVHDGARPLCPPEVFGRVIAAAAQTGAATAATPCLDTIKQVADGRVVATLDRAQLVAVQTPQAFRAAVLRRGHQSAPDADAGDDCVLVERVGEPVAVVDGDVRNRKITLADDLVWLRRMVDR